MVKNFLDTENKISTFSLSSQFVIEPGIDDCNYCCQLVEK